MDFRKSISSLISDITDICGRSGRDPSKVNLVAVTKTIPAATINRYLAEISDLFPHPIIGENKVQEVLAKKSELTNHRLHLIGHLQTNKVKQVLPHIDYLHSLDSIKLADTLEKELVKTDREFPVLLQANPLGEESKFGGDWESTLFLFRHCLSLPHLKVKGLMTMAPFTEEEGMIRRCFAALREWRERLCQENSADLPELSMGMSHDYRIALEEGATMIRIGSALFGERPINMSG